VAFAAFRHRKAVKIKKSFFLVLLAPKVQKKFFVFGQRIIPTKATRRFSIIGIKPGITPGNYDLKPDNPGCEMKIAQS